MYLRTGFLFLFIIGLVCTNAQKSSAQEYTIPVISIEAGVQPDGAIRITEHRTYRFDGSFSWADYRLPLKGFTKISDIQVSEYNTLFINKNNEEPGSFSVGRDDNEIQIKWFYSAEDEERTFTISYTLEGALVVGPKWAEFFWNYISSSREKDTDLLKINWKLPAVVKADSIYTWKRGARESLSIMQNDNGYTAKAADIDDDEFIKIRAVFPRTVLDSNAVKTNDENFSLAWAQADEKLYQKELATRLKQEEKMAELGRILTVIISVLSILAFIMIYRRYGKRPIINTGPIQASTMIPGRLKPAAAGWLLSKSISSSLLMATLLDLARQRFFIIKEQKPKKKMMGKDQQVFTIEKVTPEPGNAETEWEADLLQFVSEQVEKGNNRLDKLFSESSTSANKWFNQWKKKLKPYCQAKNWYDDTSYKGVYWNIAVQLLMILAGILAAIWAGPIAVIALAPAFVALVCSFTIIRRTPAGERLYHRWKAYKEGLQNVEKHHVDKDMLEKHFIYALAFGLSSSGIETVFEQSGASNIYFYWFVFHGHGNHSAARTAATFSSLGVTGATAFPGATAAAGSAAGASAGVAGGGAAGGAG